LVKTSDLNRNKPDSLHEKKNKIHKSMKEGQNCNYEKKVAYKSAKRPLVKKKKERKEKK
jgi:hypothetical protein